MDCLPALFDILISEESDPLLLDAALAVLRHYAMDSREYYTSIWESYVFLHLEGEYLQEFHSESVFTALVKTLSHPNTIVRNRVLSIILHLCATGLFFFFFFSHLSSLISLLSSHLVPLLVVSVCSH